MAGPPPIMYIPPPQPDPREMARMQYEQQLALLERQNEMAQPSLLERLLDMAPLAIQGFNAWTNYKSNQSLADHYKAQEEIDRFQALTEAQRASREQEEFAFKMEQLQKQLAESEMPTSEYFPQLQEHIAGRGNLGGEEGPYLPDFDPSAKALLSALTGSKNVGFNTPMKQVADISGAEQQGFENELKASAEERLLMQQLRLLQGGGGGGGKGKKGGGSGSFIADMLKAKILNRDLGEVSDIGIPVRPEETQQQYATRLLRDAPLYWGNEAPDPVDLATLFMRITPGLYTSGEEEGAAEQADALRNMAMLLQLRGVDPSVMDFFKKNALLNPTPAPQVTSEEAPVPENSDLSPIGYEMEKFGKSLGSLGELFSPIGNALATPFRPVPREEYMNRGKLPPEIEQMYQASLMGNAPHGTTPDTFGTQGPSVQYAPPAQSPWQAMLQSLDSGVGIANPASEDSVTEDLVRLLTEMSTVKDRSGGFDWSQGDPEAMTRLQRLLEMARSKDAGPTGPSPSSFMDSYMGW